MSRRRTGGPPLSLPAAAPGAVSAALMPALPTFQALQKRKNGHGLRPPNVRIDDERWTLTLKAAILMAQDEQLTLASCL